MQPSIQQYARGRWYSILCNYVSEKYLTGKHGPCPICDKGKDRFIFTDKDDIGGWYCNTCKEGGDGVKLIQKLTGKTFKEIFDEIRTLCASNRADKGREFVKSKDSNYRYLKAVSAASKKINGGDPVSLYLKARGLKTFPPKIRYIPSWDYFEDGKSIGKFPVMVNTITNSGGAPVSLHLTYIDGTAKAGVPCPRKILAPVLEMKGSAIRLSGVGEHIGIAEGVETALAVSELYKVPCWSVMNTSLMESFEPPQGVKEVTVFYDNDKNYAGQRAAYTTANKLYNKGYGMDVWGPLERGDYLDELRKGTT